MGYVDLFDVARFVIAPLAAAIVGGLLVHFGARRRDLENDRRRQRVDYLVTAYRTLTRAAQRDLRGERGEAFEDALSDVVMLGDSQQINLTQAAIADLAANREASLDALLLSLRGALRAELDLPSDGLQQVPAVRINWGTGSLHTPLRLTNTTNVTFDTELARTGAAVAAAIRSKGSDAIEPVRATSPEVAELHNMAEMAPGAAVVTAYGLVSTTLVDLLEYDYGGGDQPESFDAVALARTAEQRGLVSAELVRGVEGLSILMDLSRNNGAGTGLSVEKAHDYVNLVAATLYTLAAPPPLRP